MELKHIKELMAAMGRTGTKRMTLKKDNNFELTLEREESREGRFPHSPLEYSEESFKQPALWSRADQTLFRASEAPEQMLSSALTETPKEDANSVYITSPMVGTFYMAPSPEDPPFARKGDKVDKNTVVCIIEAMKVMNEIKANMKGAIAEVLVETGQPVEFGTKLFRIMVIE